MRASILTDRLSTAAVCVAWAGVLVGLGVAGIVAGAALARDFDATAAVLVAVVVAWLGGLALVPATRFRAAHRRAASVQR